MKTSTEEKPRRDMTRKMVVKRRKVLQRKFNSLMTQGTWKWMLNKMIMMKTFAHKTIFTFHWILNLRIEWFTRYSLLYIFFLQETKVLSTHEKELQKMRLKIEQMEKANLEPKSWTMQGEVFMIAFSFLSLLIHVVASDLVQSKLFGMICQLNKLHNLNVFRSIINSFLLCGRLLLPKGQKIVLLRWTLTLSTERDLLL